MAQASRAVPTELQELGERFEIWRWTRKAADGIAVGECKMWRHHSRRAVLAVNRSNTHRLRQRELSVNVLARSGCWTSPGSQAVSRWERAMRSRRDPAWQPSRAKTVGKRPDG